jgi:hypothetical protein
MKGHDCSQEQYYLKWYLQIDMIGTIVCIESGVPYNILLVEMSPAAVGYRHCHAIKDEYAMRAV